jgi:hypothetical protein
MERKKFKQLNKRELNWLKESSQAVASAKKPVRFVLFSKKGFEINQDEVLMFDAKQLAEDSTH